MKSLRLLPIVLVALSALLVLKGVGLLTNGGYTLLGVEVAVAQGAADDAGNSEETGVENLENSSDTRLSTAEETAAQRAADALFSSTNTPVPGTGEEDAAPVVENSNGEITIFDPNGGAGNTEDAVLQRLSDRRSELDSRERALELQEGLVAAAEARLNERISNLEAVEARVQSLLDQQSAQEGSQFEALVSMYANMKPSDAATVFNSLDMDILLRLATKMSPRKMSPILADMSTERAQQLTVRIARAQMTSQTLDLPNNANAQTDDELPQIVGQ